MIKLCTVAALSLVALGVHAQDFPGGKPITMVVPFAAGGPTDRVARDLAEAMQRQLGNNPVIIENLGGAGSTIGTTKVARAKNDGFTLLVTHVGMATTPLLYRKLSYNYETDFEYLGIINDVPMTLLGTNKLNANTYRDFEAYIRANGGKLNLAHAGLGSASHICGLMWQSAVKLDKSMTTIAYRGTGPAMNDLIGGQVDVMCDQTTNTTAQIEAGRVKAFAVTTAKPLSSHKLPKDYPSLQEMGLKGFNLTIWHGLYAPKGTPADVTKKLNDALQVALKDPEFIKSQQDLGAIVASDNRITPAGHKAFVAGEITKLKTAIEAAGQFAD
jgi:tripartite-type tricarboxylate transporter receptor subunit TctC